MERLTYFDNGKWRVKIGDTEYSGETVDRLAAYEDTGLEPENIISAADMAKITCALHEFNVYKKLDSLDRLRELAEADREGRCVVLPRLEPGQGDNPGAPGVPGPPGIATEAALKAREQDG